VPPLRSAGRISPPKSFAICPPVLNTDPRNDIAGYHQVRRVWENKRSRVEEKSVVLLKVEGFSGDIAAAL
jgi:hypothetical protein